MTFWCLKFSKKNNAKIWWISAQESRNMLNWKQEKETELGVANRLQISAPLDFWTFRRPWKCIQPFWIWLVLGEMAGGDLGNKLSKVNDIKLIYRYCKIVLRKKLPRYCLKKKSILMKTQEMMPSRHAE